MPTKRSFNSVSMINGTTLTTAYGTKGGTGWITQPLNVERFDYIMLEFDLDWSAATDVTFLFRFGPSDELTTDAPDATINNAAKVVNQGATPLADDEVVRNTGSADDKFGFLLDVRGKPRIIIQAKGTAASSDVLVARYAPYKQESRPPIEG